MTTFVAESPAEPRHQAGVALVSPKARARLVHSRDNADRRSSGIGEYRIEPRESPHRLSVLGQLPRRDIGKVDASGQFGEHFVIATRNVRAGMRSVRSGAQKHCREKREKAAALRATPAKITTHVAASSRNSLRTEWAVFSLLHVRDPIRLDALLTCERFDRALSQPASADGSSLFLIAASESEFRA